MACERGADGYSEFEDGIECICKDFMRQNHGKKEYNKKKIVSNILLNGMTTI